MTFRRLVQKGLDVFSYVLFCGGASVFAYQVYRWMRFGAWTAVSLQKVIITASESLTGVPLRNRFAAWPGLQKTVDVFLVGARYVPFSAFLIVLAVFIMVYFDDDLKMKE